MRIKAKDNEQVNIPDGTVLEDEVVTETIQQQRRKSDRIPPADHLS